MKRTLVTGASGFVGANLARRLLREGHEVHLLVRPGYSGWRLEDLRADAVFHELEPLGDGVLEALVRDVRPDWIFHLAAYGAYSWQTRLEPMLRTNIELTAHLLEASLAAGFEAFVFAGTSSEYGPKDHAPSEDEACEPSGDYAATKLMAAEYCRAAARRRSAPVCGLRLYSVFGPYEDPGRFVPALFTRGLQGRLPALVRPEAAHDFVYIDDVCEAFLAAASRAREESGEIFNIGTGRQTTIREAVETARQVLGIRETPSWGSLPSRPWDTATWVARPEKAGLRLGWSPKEDFESGFVKTLAWYRANPWLSEIYEQKRTAPAL